MPPALWIKHLPPAQFVPFTPRTEIVVTNACLGYELGDGRAARATLSFLLAGHGSSSSSPLAVVSFAKDTSEQARLDLVLEPHVDYVFHVDGPYPIDLLGRFWSLGNNNHDDDDDDDDDGQPAAPSTKPSTSSNPGSGVSKNSKARDPPKPHAQGAKPKQHKTSPDTTTLPQARAPTSTPSASSTSTASTIRGWGARFFS